MIIRSYTVYFYYQKSKSCILYFGMDGRNEKEVLKLGRSMAKLWEDHLNSLKLSAKKLKITVKVEEYKSHQ